MKETDNSPVQLTPVQTERQQAASRVAGHVRQASRNTGISFGYLMAQAGKESDFQANSSNRKSSAAGLYQFTRSTWMQLVKTHGASYGLGDLADKIHKNAHGEYTVSDATTRQQILDLRRDPKLSSMMAGEYAKDNKAWLERSLGRPVSSTDLYMAHFLGPGGAAKVLKARDNNPEQAAADLVPQAARKNPSVFYDSNHSAQSVAAVYDKIHHAIERPMQQYSKMEGAPAVDSAEAMAMADSSVLSEVGGNSVASVQKLAKTPKPQPNQIGTPTASQPALTAPAKQVAGPEDVQWPFEQTHWPPTYVPSVNPSTVASASIIDAQEKVNYTDANQSADQISSPMPPAPGLTMHDAQKAASLNKILKSLRG